MGTDWINVALGVPVFGVILIMVLLRKIIPGWALDDQEKATEKRVTELKESHERELRVRDEVIVILRANLADMTKELKETGPTLVRANDGLRATQDLLREFLHRGAGT